MKKSKKIAIPKTKKSLKAFLTSEEGKISNESIIKIGLTVVSSAVILSGVIKPDSHLANATCAHSSHSSHGSHGAHGSHGSHGSHGQW